MMDYQAFKTKAGEFMLNRGWKEKTAKRRVFEQSLFDHTMIEIDALVILLPLLCQTFVPALTEQEEQVLLTSALAHDVGKELDEWQEYVMGRRDFLSDVNRELAEEIVPQLAELLGFTGVEEMLSGVLLHMRYERTPARVTNRLLFGGHSNPRWKMLADIVDAVDNLCSAKGLFAGLQCLEERSFLSNHLRISYHLVQIRGVSTTLLHRAAIDAFVERGWNPLLHYSNGTIYIASSVIQAQEPRIEEIETRLAEIVKQTLPSPSQMASLIVGSPLQSMIPKADLFDYTELRQYLQVAATRVNRASFQKKPESTRRKVVGKYLVYVDNFNTLKGNPKSAIVESDRKWKKGHRPNIDADTLALQTTRIATAQVSTSAPMNRGLKVQTVMRNPNPRGVSTSAPMNRGLKGTSLISTSCPKGRFQPLPR